MFKDGDKKPENSGRKEGVGNKLTTELKEMILGALDAAGGMGYLTTQAKTNPVAFLSLLGKVLPMQIKADITSRRISVNIIMNDNGGHQPQLTHETIHSIQ